MLHARNGKLPPLPRGFLGVGGWRTRTRTRTISPLGHETRGRRPIGGVPNRDWEGRGREGETWEGEREGGTRFRDGPGTDPLLVLDDLSFLPVSHERPTGVDKSIKNRRVSENYPRRHERRHNGPTPCWGLSTLLISRQLSLFASHFIEGTDKERLFLTVERHIWLVSRVFTRCGALLRLPINRALPWVSTAISPKIAQFSYI